LVTGSVKYLSSSRLHCIDCQVVGGRLEAGWVYSDGYLMPVETLTDGHGFEVRVTIPDDLQPLQQPATFSFINEPVEFYLA
jgi:hypothetical protein